MATTQKLSETGWFYHAPAKKNQSSEPAPTPYASQIPGLNDLPPEPLTEHQKHMMVNDFDSEYVRLAKQGGRADLLRMRTPKPRSEEAVPYPRVNWYYQSDIEVEEGEKDTDEKTPHQFLLPDYMVHHSYNGPNAAAESPTPSVGKRCIKQKQKPSPFATDSNLSFQGQTAGKGVAKGRRGRESNGQRDPIVQSPAGASTRQKATAPVAELDRDRIRPKQMALPSDHDKPNMSKLMGHGYIKDWQHERDTWFDKQQKVKEQFDDVTLQRQTANLRVNDTTTVVDERAAGDAPEAPARQNGGTNVEREPFKLSKFKNVPARTDSHAPAAYQKTKASGDPPAQ